MKKFNLHLIGNTGDYNYYVFDKHQEVAKKLSNLFYVTFNLDYDLTEEYDEKKDEWVKRERKIIKCKDVHERVVSLSNSNRINIFYGDKRMFVTILCSQKLRVKFNESLFKFFKMSKPVKLKKVKR